MTQPSDIALRLLNDVVEEFARATRFPLAFGGYEHDGVVNVTALAGNQTQSLRGLQVVTDRGLGGRAMREKRPRMTADYSRSRLITHDYDSEVLAEQVQILLAMPVMIGDTVRAVLYGGSRGGHSPGTSFVQVGASVARDFAREIVFEDEVAKRLASRPVAAATRGVESDGTVLSQQYVLPNTLREELRGGHAELRRIAASCDDPELQQQLRALEQRLAKIGSFGGPDPRNNRGSHKPTVRLTPRELDVLAYAALGRTNAEIGVSLMLTESTVKSYLKAAMAKLGVSSRHAAVAEARRIGLIP